MSGHAATATRSNHVGRIVDVRPGYPSDKKRVAELAKNKE